jgi:hypothetical protein
LLIVMRRGSLRAAEEVTGHKYETIGNWLRRAAAHAAELTDVLVDDLHLTAVEVDEFWSFVQTKRGAMQPPVRSLPTRSISLKPLQPPRPTALPRVRRAGSGGGA